MSVLDALLLALLVAAGFGAGFVNTIAGAGSLLTLPALIFSGLPADAANATNRVAVLVQNVVAIAAFRRSGVAASRRAMLAVAVPATLASFAGAYVATLLTAAQTQAALVAAMVAMVALSFVRPRREPETQPGETREKAREPAPSVLLIVAFLGLGFYGGMLQAGLGIAILLWLSLVHRVDLVVGNALKVVVIGALTVAALVLFAARGETIDLLRGGALSIGTAAGAWLGARQAVKRGEKWIRLVVVLAVLASAAKLALDLHAEG